MKFKKIIPYVIISVATMFPASIAKPHSVKYKTKKEYKPIDSMNTKNEVPYDLQKQQLKEKACQVVATYINNAIDGTKRINANKKKYGYSAAVRKELPGAPVARHCLYGQYTQLNRALEQFGDTIQIIPQISKASTDNFKTSMSKLYDNSKYPDAIYRGHFYASDKEYNEAFNRFLTAKTRGKAEISDSLRNALDTEFAKHNYCASELNPGTIIVDNTGHAIMFLGFGTIENGEFVSNINGKPVSCAYNKEHAAIYISYFNVSNSFAVDIQNIIIQKYYAQLEKQY